MTSNRWRGPAPILVCASLILTCALGIRHGFGLFLQPMSMENGWGREVFGLAIAVQNLMWGLAQPFTGMIADRYGAGRVIFAGGLLYAAGVALMACSTSPAMLLLSGGLLVGLALSCTTFNIVYGALGRAYPPERRSAVLGTSSAFGSMGQFVLMPVTLLLIAGQGWFNAMLVLAALSLLIMPFSLGIDERGYHGQPAGQVSLREAIREAFRHKGFWLLGFGYFTCGFQITFIGTHLPAFVLDQGLGAATGTAALALIGLFNVVGSWGAGYFGGRYPKTWLLSGLYATRGLAILGLMTLPMSTATIYGFAIIMGLTWLSTVPLTNGVVAGIFGVRHLAMLAGLVFFFHQIGAFFGGWLGGYAYDVSGSYQLVWLLALGLSVTATLLNLPIDERPIARGATPAAA
jgi:MFS family permease